jgi:hypothetical protein
VILITYHKVIEKGIKLFGNKHLHGAVLSHKKITLFICHPNNLKIKPIIYKPDMVFTLSDKRKYTFQVLDSQLKHKREIEADIFRAFLCAEVSRLVFIVPTQQGYVMVKGIVDIIHDTLYNYDINPKALPIVLIIKIPKHVKGDKTVLKYLEEVESQDKEIFKQK